MAWFIFCKNLIGISPKIFERLCRLQINPNPVEDIYVPTPLPFTMA
jgi:hypothetical protein